MDKRLVLTEGRKVLIVAQDDDFGDAKNFSESRDSKTCDLIGEHGNIFSEQRMHYRMTSPSLDIKSNNFFTIIDKEDGRYLGDIFLSNTEFGYEIGIVIVSEERRKGYGSDAILAIVEYILSNIAERVYLRVYRNNLRAYKFCKKLGFDYLMTTDEGYTVNGESILEDWLAIGE